MRLSKKVLGGDTHIVWQVVKLKKRVEVGQPSHRHWLKNLSIWQDV